MLKHFQWEKNIPLLKEKFTSHKQKYQNKTNEEMIMTLNDEVIKADKVIIRQILTKMSKKQQLSKNSTLEQIQSFFDLLKENYLQTEENYLKQYSVNTKDQQISKDNHENQHENDIQTGKKRKKFQKNKTMIQKFIKDQQIFNSSAVNSFLQESKQGQNGICGTKIVNFINKLFNETQYIKIFRNGKNYFNQIQHQKQIQQVIKKYALSIEEISEQSFQLQSFFLNENQILAFLTYWLQDQKNINQLKIIYARTKQTMQKITKNYLQKIKNKNQLIHSNNVEKSLQKSNSQKILNSDSKNLDPDNQKNINLKNLRAKSKSNFQSIPSEHLLNRFRTSLNQQIEEQPHKNPPKKPLTKQEQLEKLLPQIFSYSCKKRIKFNKFTTFDSINEQSKQMNIQKFINLCVQIGISDLFARQFLMDLFKLQAINRLSLNLQRFQKVIKKLLQKNPQVLDKLLSMTKLMNKKKQISIDEIKRNSSKYNYQIRPVNGKDIQSIQIQLQEKKKVKQIIKKQKQQILIKKRQGYFDKYQNIRNKLEKQASIIRSNFNNEQSYIDYTDSTAKFLNNNSHSLIESKINSQRVNSQKFNPQSLIYNYGEEDKLWEEYESKIWSKDKNIQNKNQFQKLNNAHRKGQISTKKIANQQPISNLTSLLYNYSRQNQQKRNIPQSKSKSNAQINKFQLHERKYRQSNPSYSLNYLNSLNNQNDSLNNLNFQGQNKFNSKQKNYVSKKNYKNNQSILEEALSRRIEKGNNVLKKIASSNLKYYV